MEEVVGLGFFHPYKLIYYYFGVSSLGRELDGFSDH